MNPSLKPVLLVAFGEEENLGVGYLMSVLQGAGITSRMIDIRYDSEEILAAIKRESPVVVGFSVIYETCLDGFTELVSYLRKGGVDCHFTAGGHYASLYPEELFGFIPGLDSVVRFEGEYTFPELVNCLVTASDWKGLRNLAYRENGRVIRTPLREPEKNLDNFPYPYRRPLREYALGKRYSTIISGRGCTYSCSFCNTGEFYRQAGGPLKRIRRPEAVVDEMLRLYSESGCRIFLFQDDDNPVKTAGGNLWIKSFCSEIERTGLLGRVIWKMNCRPDEIDPEIFSMMKSHGLFLVFIGLEDGTDEGLKRFNKKMTVESARYCVEVLRQLGIGFDYGYILFQPESTFSSLRESLRFLEEICRDNLVPITFLKLIPYFGTRVERELREAGRLTGRPGNFDYSYLTPALDACWGAVLNCFDEWLWGRRGAVNLAKWVRNCLAVRDHFGKPDEIVERQRSTYCETVAQGNQFLAETLYGLFDCFESGRHLSEGQERIERIALESARRHDIICGTFRENLRALQEESWR